jgi:hypothetical protein
MASRVEEKELFGALAESSIPGHDNVCNGLTLDTMKVLTSMTTLAVMAESSPTMFIARITLRMI